MKISSRMKSDMIQSAQICQESGKKESAERSFLKSGKVHASDWFSFDRLTLCLCKAPGDNFLENCFRIINNIYHFKDATTEYW